MSEEENKQDKDETTGEEKNDIVSKPKANKASKPKGNEPVSQKVPMDKVYMNKISIYAGVVMVFSILILIVITNVSADNGNQSKADVAVVSTTVEPSQTPEQTEEPTPKPTKEPAVTTSNTPAITPQPQTPTATTPVPVPTRAPKSRNNIPVINTQRPPVYQPPVQNHVAPQPTAPPKPTTAPTQRPITADDFEISVGKSGGKYIINISAPEGGKNCSYVFSARENNESAYERIYPTKAGDNVYGWVPPKSDAIYEFRIDISYGGKKIGYKRG
ncbi:MAG TPA: hypothetical protein VF941_21995 [Clostridia bacterium]